MKSKRIILIIITILIILLSNITSVYATNFNITVSSEKNAYTQGEKINIKISIDNIENINEIYGVIGKIEYDKNVFEDTISNITTKWNDIEYNEATGEFIVIRNSSIQDENEIVEIELSVKENAKIGETAIEIKQLTASDSQADIEIEDAKLSIEIKEADSENTDKTPEPTSTQLPNQTVAPTPTPELTLNPNVTNSPVTSTIPTTTPKTEYNYQQNTTSKTETTTTYKNAKTGDLKPIIAIGIIAFVIIGNVIYFIVNKKTNKE